MRSIRLFISVLILFVSFVSKAQFINTIAGNGSTAFGGDGGPLINAKLWTPTDIIFDPAGNMYIADNCNHRIRKVDNSGIITTIVGTGVLGNSGDGGPATSAQLAFPIGITFDAAGNLYIADSWNNNIRKVNTSGVITTIAGTGASGYSGDGGPAINATFNSLGGVSIDAAGNIYVPDGNNNRIRKISPAGTITTYMGNGTSGNTGNGGPPASAKVSLPAYTFMDNTGNLYIAEAGNNCIRKVNTSGIVSTVAGLMTTTPAYAGDGGPAVSARMNFPTGLKLDAAGNIYIADRYNNVIRKVNTSGIISTYAGNVTNGFSGDGGPATSAQLNEPYGLGVDVSGNVYITDSNNERIRKITLTQDIDNELFESNDLVYPNPANSFLNLHFKTNSERTVTLLDELGQELFTAKCNDDLKIDLSEFAPGVYILNTRSNEVLSSRKIIVAH
jgi:trimeric autotransporter adhesin